MSGVPIHEWPESTRPRERLLTRGAQSLSDDELLALLVGSGTARRSALVIANEVLRRIGGTRSLGQSDVARLRECGLGVATAVRVAAACEIGRRVVAANGEGERCDTAELAAAALAPHFAHLERECLVVALLSRKQRLIGVAPLYFGNVAGTSVRIAELFTEAVRRNASGILLAHNHPSGDPSPSADDIRTTKDAVAAGRLLGIEVVDHLVFGAGRWASLRRSGCW
ncbi:MAG TPA: DNA repair protein RadC [Candidatus Limnocylindria bacterium]|nr:DNA repair protein RadC [Candidatus Limnocylindria bacterium]